MLLALPLAATGEDPPTVTMDEIVVPLRAAPGASRADPGDLAAQRAVTGDAAELLRSVPGLSLHGAGGISSLPVIHGLADDRVRVLVDGADLTPACPNHMNSPLSYADPSRIVGVVVYSGLTPVSVGGDAIGGSIQVRSAPPEFAGADEGVLAQGRAGSFYRSNGDAHGYHVGATAAGRWLSLSYDQSDSQSDDYRAGGSFKPVAPGREGGPPIAGDEVGSSAYRGATSRALVMALSRWGHTVELALSQQTVRFEGYPNQRMDMTGNDNRLLSARYTGRFAWGELEARLSYQTTRHEMDMGPDRYSYGTGMPMDTRAKTRGALLKGDVVLSPRDLLRAGVEAQYYTLYDWWPPVGGSMGPNAFWNVDFGERRKLDAFAEWEARWTSRWTSLVGVRSDTVSTDAGPVEGYDNGLAAAWGEDAAAFNAARRARTDHNWDLTVLARHAPAPTQLYELGYARASRAPNLYQRYAWSTNPMAALMNNLVGDGNGYVGKIDLRPEIAHTFSLTGDWHDAARERWGLRATGYYTRVEDYIDARRCRTGQCSPANAGATDGFVLLQYVNQSARLYGLDLSGHLPLGTIGALGSFTGTATLGWVRGENLTTGDNLYDIMSPSANLAVVQALGSWTGTAEVVAVADKDRVSQVRNELRTGGYWLLNLRGAYAWKHVRLDLGLENLLNRLHANPLGGAYVGQGASMTTSGIRWGVPVPGPGRSVNVALDISL
jgi:iron complex outermembrane recepter protein